ncbi:MAG: hypothetical protein ACOC33_02010 [bacterium]
MKKFNVILLIVFCLVVVGISYLRMKPKKIKDVFEQYETLEMFI